MLLIAQGAGIGLWQHILVRQERYDHVLPIEVSYQGQTFQAMTRNLSLGGVGIDLAVALPFGAAVGLKFHVPTMVEPIIVHGEVRWSEPGGGVGVCFHGLRAREVWALNRLFRQAENTQRGAGEM